MELKNNALFKETCFIGGKWIESDSKEKIKVDNPANGEIIGEVPKWATSETRKAVRAAQSAVPLPVPVPPRVQTRYLKESVACLLYTSPSPRDS